MKVEKFIAEIRLDLANNFVEVGNDRVERLLAEYDRLKAEVDCGRKWIHMNEPPADGRT